MQHPKPINPQHLIPVGDLLRTNLKSFYFFHLKNAVGKVYTRDNLVNMDNLPNDIIEIIYFHKHKLEMKETFDSINCCDWFLYDISFDEFIEFRDDRQEKLDEEHYAMKYMHDESWMWCKQCQYGICDMH